MKAYGDTLWKPAFCLCLLQRSIQTVSFPMAFKDFLEPNVALNAVLWLKVYDINYNSIIFSLSSIV
jgi:hypothetical protein